MKKILLYAAFIYMLPANAEANHERNNAHSEAIRQYTSQNIMPVLLAKRQVFDAFLNSDEQNKLTSIRQQLNTLRENFHAAMIQRSEATPEQNTAMISSDERKNNRESMKELMSEVRAIADNHKEELDKIMKDLEPQREQWKNDISNLIASAQDEKEESASSFPVHHNWMNGNMFRTWGRVGFVLLNSSKTITADNNQKVSMADVLPGSSIDGMNIYPNPAADQFTLNLPGNPVENKLIITDMKGRVVTERENVLPSETISCNNLENGIYFVQLSSGNEIVNKKLVVSH